MSWREEAKRRAALASVKHVKDGNVIGLGTGSTVLYAILEIGRMVREGGLNVLGIPTSEKTKSIAVNSGVPLTTLDEHPSPDIAIDGADQVDEELNMIKGLGAALTREKILDSAAKLLVIVVDETKLTKKLGLKQVVPVEVLPFAIPPVSNALREMGGKPILRTFGSEGKLVETDNGNFIVDVDFGPIDDPEGLEKEIKMIPGIIECGLFLGMADIVYVGYRKGVKKLAFVSGKPRVLQL